MRRPHVKITLPDPEKAKWLWAQPEHAYIPFPEIERAMGFESKTCVPLFWAARVYDWENSGTDEHPRYFVRMSAMQNLQDYILSRQGIAVEPAEVFDVKQLVGALNEVLKYGRLVYQKGK